MLMADTRIQRDQLPDMCLLICMNYKANALLLLHYQCIKIASLWHDPD